jgi:tetratricopeptide (TPR) repeat protein
MRQAMIAPMMLLMGATSVPPPPPELPRAGWCGGDMAGLDVPDPATVLLPGYGQGGFKISTKSPEAQAFFDNGMQLAHAFAHKAAIAAFQEARRLDPDCAMCVWGEAWASGPTINYGVSADDAKKLADIVATAEKLAASGPARERNLIGALKQRYPAAGKGGNAAFAAAMEQMAGLAPGDDEILTITADAHMIATDDANAENMARPVALLETVLKRNPDYAPAIHFYIHATEGAGYPQRAEPYADKLKTIAPAASHLIHMPSHTYYWIGRYADAASANLAAVGIDEQNAARLKLTGPDAVWKLSYHAHNVHFGIAGALMSGDAATGLTLARPLAAAASTTVKMNDFRQAVTGVGYVAVAHFGPASEMLGLAKPAAGNPIATAMWHYARGEALARSGDAQRVLAEARAIPAQATGSFAPYLSTLYAVNRLVLQGRAAMLSKRYDDAARLFTQAAALEEAKPFSTFSDPPLFWYPVRRDVAAALLAKGDAAGALAAADASLKYRPLDPVALEFRAQAQAKLGNAAAARHDRQQALAGWRGQRISLGR